jgi:hypothetical protein
MSLIGTYAVTGLTVFSSVAVAVVLVWGVLAATIRAIAPGPAPYASSPVEPE